jgi:hypothetical protein
MLRSYRPPLQRPVRHRSSLWNVSRMACGNQFTWPLTPAQRHHRKNRCRRQDRWELAQTTRVARVAPAQGSCLSSRRDSDDVRCPGRLPCGEQRRGEPHALLGQLPDGGEGRVSRLRLEAVDREDELTDRVIVPPQGLGVLRTRGARDLVMPDVPGQGVFQERDAGFATTIRIGSEKSTSAVNTYRCNCPGTFRVSPCVGIGAALAYTRGLGVSQLVIWVIF